MSLLGDLIMEARESGAAPETREAPRTNITVLVSTLSVGILCSSIFRISSGKY